MSISKNIRIFAVCAMVAVISSVGFADDKIVTSVTYVTDAIATRQPVASANYQVSKSDGTWTALGTTLDSSANGYVAENAVTAGTVAGALANKQDKPASGFASGKVLTYSGSTAASPTASYVHVPVANADPNASSNPGTVSSLASVWIQ